jgi:hypothetical protein
MHTPKRAGIPYNVGFMLGTEVRTTRSLTYCTKSRPRQDLGTG